MSFATSVPDRPSDEALECALRGALALAEEAPVELIRSGSPYASTFPLEKLQVRLPDGEHTQLAFKRLQWNARTPGCARPAFLFDAAREPEVYRSLLPAGPCGPPRHLVSVPADSDGSWLFIEWVDGRELHQVGEWPMWLEAARWLGEFHAALAGDVERHARQAHLVEHDAAYYEGWLARARRFATVGGRAAEANFLEWLAERYDVAVEGLLALPRTVIHGDFHAANILVSGAPGEVRVTPVDWELAAAGPGLVDLAALTSGEWSSQERQAMTQAYASSSALPAFSLRQLDFARLHLAVQWLGWAQVWEPPKQQRRDWLAEAVAIAEDLDL